MSKSKDLREATAYKKTGISQEETDDLSNKPLNRSFKKIDPEKLKAYAAEHPDDTQKEVSAVLGCCNQAISQAYRRLGITRKKRHYAMKNKTVKKQKSILKR